MPPSPSIRAAIRRACTIAPRTRDGLVAAVLCLLMTCLAALPASADTNAPSKPAVREAVMRTPLVTVKSPAPAPRLPQTRYTVRKQIESIEPISWLERYGKVRVRELKP